MANIFRPPLITRREPARGTFEHGPPNLLLTTLLSKDKFPPGKTQDYPNPRGYIHPVELRTFLDPLKLNLRSKDKFFGPAGMGPTYDWPNPRGPLYPISLRTFLDPVDVELVGKDKFPPGKLYDYPNPRGPLYPIELRTFLNPIEQQLIGKDKFPTGKLYDFPNPLGRPHPVSLLSWEENLQQSTLAVVIFPFALSDWPNPIGPTAAISLRTWTQETKLNLLGQDQVFRQPVVGRLERARWPMPEQVQNFLPIIFIKPFLMSDWPVPPGPIYSVGLRTWTKPVNLTLIAQDAFPPGKLYDYPNPLIARATISLRTFTTPLNPNLPPPTPPARTGRLLYNLDTGQLEWMVSATAPGAPILVINL